MSIQVISHDLELTAHSKPIDSQASHNCVPVNPMTNKLMIRCSSSV